MERARKGLGYLFAAGKGIIPIFAAATLLVQAAHAAPGDIIDRLNNDWSYSTLGLAYDPVRNIVRYAHESRSSEHNPTIYDYVPGTGSIVYSVALSVQNHPDWPWGVDSRTGVSFDPDTGTYFLPDYNGDLSYCDDNIIEIDAQGNILAAWETDDEVGSNDSTGGGEIDNIVDITHDPDHPRRYYTTAAYDDNTIYYVDLSDTSSGASPENAWTLLDTITPAGLDGIIGDIIGIEWDAVNEGFWVTDYHSANIALLDRDFNLVQWLAVDTAGGFSSGITPMNSVAPGEPYQLWVTDFTSDQTTIVESLSQRPPAIPMADIHVTKDDGSDTYLPGTFATYTVVVANSGPQAAEDVRLEDSAPADTSITGWECTAAGGAVCPAPAGSGDIDQTVDLLPPGGTLTYTVDLWVTPFKNPTEPLSNTASVTSPTSDPDPANNAATDTNGPFPGALGVIKSDGRPVYTPGTTVTYHLAAANLSAIPVPDFRITDTPPAGTTMHWQCHTNPNSPCPTPDSGSGALDYNTALDSGEFLYFAVEVDVPSGFTGELTNTADISGSGAPLLPATASDTDAQFSITDLSVTNTDGHDTYIPGTSRQYTLTALNSGPSDASSVRIQDTAAPGTSITGWTCTSSAGASCPNPGGAGNLDETVPVLPAGESLVYTLTLAIEGDYGQNGGMEAALINSARISGNDHDPNPANNSATDRNAPRTYTVTAAAGQGGSISPTARTVGHGQTATFTLTPEDGYEIDSVSSTCDGSLSGDTYTAGPVTGDCTVTAAFTMGAPIPSLSEWGMLLTALLMGAIAIISLRRRPAG
jgi:uncharacterized repeat protein (TIGR01451 family)